MKDVIEIIDGKTFINKCFESPDVCKNNGVCKMQKKLFQIRNIIAKELDAVTIYDVINEKI